MLSRRTPSHPFARKVRSVHQGQLAQNKPESRIWEGPQISPENRSGFADITAIFPFRSKPRPCMDFFGLARNRCQTGNISWKRGGVCVNGFAWHEWSPRRSVKVRLSLSFD